MPFLAKRGAMRFLDAHSAALAPLLIIYISIEIFHVVRSRRPHLTPIRRCEALVFVARRPVINLAVQDAILKLRSTVWGLAFDSIFRDIPYNLKICMDVCAGGGESFVSMGFFVFRFLNGFIFNFRPESRRAERFTTLYNSLCTCRWAYVLNHFFTWVLRHLALVVFIARVFFYSVFNVILFYNLWKVW